MELERLNVKATIRTAPDPTDAVDPRLAAEVKAINAAFDSATKALDADRNSLPAKSTAPVQIASFEC